MQFGSIGEEYLSTGVFEMLVSQMILMYKKLGFEEING